VITAATDEDGAVLVQHAYVSAHARSYMLYSASVLADSADGAMRNLIGRANRYLHWHDIRVFKERGFAFYDFGGLDVSGRSEKTTNIARFKRGFGGQVRPVYSSTHARSLRGAAIQRILALRGVDF
jgi:lipid II:glycine glycyltransferase (peptidoglycan interpeptide bridge formation enzyme)